MSSSRGLSDRRVVTTRTDRGPGLTRWPCLGGLRDDRAVRRGASIEAASNTRSSALSSDDDASPCLDCPAGRSGEGGRVGGRRVAAARWASASGRTASTCASQTASDPSSAACARLARTTARSARNDLTSCSATRAATYCSTSRWSCTLSSLALADARFPATDSCASAQATANAAGIAIECKPPLEHFTPELDVRRRLDVSGERESIEQLRPQVLPLRGSSNRAGRSPPPDSR